MKILISNSSKLPIYEQIVNSIKEEIINGTLEPNEKLPSIRSLAKDLNISVITTKRAYEELENQGLLKLLGERVAMYLILTRSLFMKKSLRK